VSLGVWEGKSLLDMGSDENRDFKRYLENPHIFIPPNGENYVIAKARIENEIKEIIKENDDGNVLIVTHGVSVRLLIGGLKNISIDKIKDMPIVHGTGLYILEVDDGNMKLVLEGDISHLNMEKNEMKKIKRKLKELVP
jgi:probable phosphoglycerate mutase